jgi:uncharacterized protein CbrC (UPF0167 family)
VEGPEWDGILASLHREGWILAFLFRCSKCGRLGGYVDFN